MLRLDSDWLWDFWLADDGTDYHLYYLQAPRSLGDPELRHWHAIVGHATSRDLVSWEVRGEVLGPGARGAWDDLSIWTGSVGRHDETWAMLYTACSSRDEGLVQRIGVATSTDLHDWVKHATNPVLEADGRWYERLDPQRWHDEAWRDPWIIDDPAGDGYHALVTARIPDGPTADAGVIGHARSTDLLEWEVQPPLTGPSGFGQLEVPQVVTTTLGHQLIFSYSTNGIAGDRHGTASGTGTWITPMASPLGPVDFDRAQRLGPAGTYSGKVVRDRAGRWQFLAFVVDPDHEDFGTLIDPSPLATYLPGVQ